MSRPRTSFNSSKVQFERTYKHIAEFQQQSFNSSKVQFEQYGGKRHRPHFHGFNSSKVQFEHDTTSQYIYVPWFQFQ